MRLRCPLSPFPDGWFFVEFSSNLPAGKLIGRQWLGEQIIVWRAPGGDICVASAVCPHMGALLSPETGGCLKKWHLVCPFHRFEYDISGNCVATPNAPPPPNCRLKRFPVQELNGFIFAYRDSTGNVPDWQLPTLDDNGWTALGSKRFNVRSHPQDIGENSVDINHLSSVHGWEQGEQTLKTQVNGRYYTAGFRYSAIPNMPVLRRFPYSVSPTVHMWGLGYIRTDSSSRDFGVEVRNWYLPVPLDGESFDAIVAVQVKRTEAPNRAPGGLPAVVSRLGLKLVRRIIMYEVAREFEKDIKIWNHRHYHDHPALCASDGNLGAYRRYCKQFYN